MEKARKIALVISWIGLGIIIVLTILVMIMDLLEVELSDEMAYVIIIAMLAGGMVTFVPGWVHCTPYCMVIIVFPFSLAFALVAGPFTSWFFIIRDTIRVIRKKPLYNPN